MSPSIDGALGRYYCQIVSHFPSPLEQPDNYSHLLDMSYDDLLAVSKLAWDVYTAYKDAPEDFRGISDEIKSLHFIVDGYKDQFQDKT